MAKHLLSLGICDTANEGIFIIEDTSIYTSSLPVSCQNLQITPPGFASPTIITPNIQGFKFVLNACTLGMMQPAGCANVCPIIPDGIYQLYYSVSPNDQVFVSYRYMRIVSAINRLDEMLCALKIPCCLPTKEMQQVVGELDMIRNFLRSAQLNINNNKSIDDGMNQYRYAIQLMDKMTFRKPWCNSNNGLNRFSYQGVN